MIEIFYPYFENESTWQELRYSLRSIECHFKFEYRVWLVGDLPAWINPGAINFIPHQRIEGIDQNTVYDAITKHLLFINHPDTGIHYVRMYDDIYLLKDVSLSDIGRFKAMYSFEQTPARTGTWWDQLSNTQTAVRQKGYPGWNCETHMPELFNKEKMNWIISVYQALENRLLTATLYYNTFDPFTQPLRFSKDYAIQFYDNVENRFYDTSWGDINKKCQGKTFLNHNNKGLSEPLKHFIESQFPTKSQYEK